MKTDNEPKGDHLEILALALTHQGATLKIRPVVNGSKILWRVSVTRNRIDEDGTVVEERFDLTSNSAAAALLEATKTLALDALDSNTGCKCGECEARRAAAKAALNNN